MNPRHRVCQISDHPPFDQRVFHRTCHSLVHAGYDTHLLVQLDEDEVTIDGIHIHAIEKRSGPMLGLQLKRRLARFWRAERIARQINVQVYHLHDMELIPLGLWLKIRTGAVVVYDSHEDNVSFILQKYYLSLPVRWLLATLMGLLEWLAGHVFDGIITADEGVANIYRRRYGAKRVQVVHNFPRLDYFPQPQANGTVEKPFDLVYHGTIPRYHLKVAFAVAEELRARNVNARWLFFGSCPDLPWAQAELARRGLTEQFVIDAERIPHEMVARRVQQARIGIIPLPDLPKFQHNIPTKLFEYMALGMPVVLSDLPPSRPFVADGKCATMVAPDAYGAYADVIVRLLNSPSLCVQMGEEGRRRVEQEYNWQKESRKLLDFYEELLNDEPQVNRNG